MAPGAATGHPARAGFKERVRNGAHAMTRPLVDALLRVGVRADHLTIAGFVLSFAAALAFALGMFPRARPPVAALLTALAGVCDLLDGQLARRTGASRFGAFLDSTLDRLGESLILAGLAWYYMSNLVDQAMNPERVLRNLAHGLEPVTWAADALLAVLALTGSFMVSYTRARAEGLGLDCKVGWFERPERMVLLIVAGLFGLGPVIPAALLLLTVLSFWTAYQRGRHVWRLTRGAGTDHLGGSAP